MILQTIYGLITLAGLITILAGLLCFKTSAAVAWTVVSTGIAMVAAGFMLDARRLKKKREDIERRITELTGAPWASGASFKVGGVWLRLLTHASLLAVCGVASARAGFLHMARGDYLPSAPLFLLGGAVLPMMAASTLMEALTGFAKPACEFDSGGFTSPVYGRISWQEVTGISYRHYWASRRLVERHELLFCVPDIQQVIRHASRLASLRYMLGFRELKQGILSIRISDRGDMPETVEAVARFLWTQATGRKSHWFPELSGAANDAFKVLDGDKLAAMNERFRDSGTMSSAEKMSALAELKEILNDSEAASRTIRDELKKRNGRTS